MASFRYFADISGEAHELTGVYFNGGASVVKASNFRGRLPSGEVVAATRKIEFKRHASRHECDARCMNATGRIMKCECSCGGKNHGRGSFVCEAA